jgi:hypothetical protein
MGVVDEQDIARFKLIKQSKVNIFHSVTNHLIAQCIDISTWKRITGYMIFVFKSWSVMACRANFVEFPDPISKKMEDALKDRRLYKAAASSPVK